MTTLNSLQQITTSINGETQDLLVAPEWTLLRLLRDELDMTGAKEGCSNGNCGACTVIIDGRTANSCLVLAAEIDGREVTTIEGIAKNGQLNAVQQALLDHSALQCGFCTPGIVVAASALLRAAPAPTPTQVREELAGNLCRCTGYEPIVNAVVEAGAKFRAGEANL
jgi:carbon-monoxide dehydrogenase small subunit